jgi:hypothetical protein
MRIPPSIFIDKSIFLSFWTHTLLKIQFFSWNAAFQCRAWSFSTTSITINEKKTKYGAGQTVAFGDKNFKVVNEFVYLGALLAPKNDNGLKIQRRIQTANMCFCGLRKYLRSSHQARQTKITIYKNLICPVLLYVSETWVLTKRRENPWFVFERKVCTGAALISSASWRAMDCASLGTR